jgi:hypothetical protein
MRKTFLNGANLASELGITPGRVSQLTSAEVLVRYPNGYELGESIRRYLENKLQNIDAPEAEKLLESRIRKLTAAVERERLMLTKINGQVVANLEAEALYTKQRNRAFAGFKTLLDIISELEACQDDKARVFELISQEAVSILACLANQSAVETP